MYALLIREMAGLLLEHRRKSEDILAHGIGVDHLMEAMLIEIACADIDSRSKVTSDSGHLQNGR